jgi:HTH-type transcriptional regulator/antitoxin HigA
MAMDIRPLVTPDDHAAALREIDRLWGAEVGTDDGDKLDLLATLVERYEEQHFPLGEADPVETIRVHMELTGRTQRDLAELLGSPSRASEVLNRKRALTMDMVHKLHKAWKMPADALITPYELDASVRRRA